MKYYRGLLLSPLLQRAVSVPSNFPLGPLLPRPPARPSGSCCAVACCCCRRRRRRLLRLQGSIPIFSRPLSMASNEHSLVRGKRFEVSLCLPFFLCLSLSLSLSVFAARFRQCRATTTTIASHCSPDSGSSCNVAAAAQRKHLSMELQKR
jgi:hypothetical protein